MGCIASKGLVKTSHQVDNIWDVFTRIKLLGRGASGEVWQVKDKKGQMFALKKLDKADPQNESMFEHECNILERLDHPNILKFNDCYEVQHGMARQLIMVSLSISVQRHATLRILNSNCLAHFHFISYLVCMRLCGNLIISLYPDD